MTSFIGSFVRAPLANFIQGKPRLQKLPFTFYRVYVNVQAVPLNFSLVEYPNQLKDSICLQWRRFNFNRRSSI